MRPTIRVHYSISLLSIMLCVDIAAAQVSELNPSPKRFSRQAEEYRYLVYKQVVLANPGLGSHAVKQRLPIGVGGLAKPETIDDQGVMRLSSEQIVEPYRLSRNKSIVVDGKQVLLCDKVTAEQAVLVKGADVELMYASTFPRTAMSPSGKRIVTAVIASEEGTGIKRSPLYEVHVVDLLVPIVIFPKITDQLVSAKRHQPKLICKNVRGEAANGSGLSPHAVAPPLLWLDEQTVLLMTPSERVDRPDADSKPDEQVIMLNNDGSIPRDYQLNAINVSTATAKTLCRLKIDLPAFRPELFPVLWRRCDGAIMLRNSAIDYRIDIENGKLIEDRRLSPQYEIRGERYIPSLWFGNEQLCESLFFRNVGISPDGRCIAWYARSVNTPDKTNLGNTSQYLTTLWFHSAETGKIELAEGNFDNSQPFLKFDNPGYCELFQWLTD